MINYEVVFGNVNSNISSLFFRCIRYFIACEAHKTSLNNM
jgi:hypothetical protein